ncbi:hypothetical protein IKJ53_06435 [bacterium]|nr:hypothetical protein [bacterium]
MLETFTIEFVREVLEHTLAKEHNKNPHLFGGDNQIKITSFYEQLKSQEEVDRFVKTYRDLTKQQNRTSLIGNGVILSPENPSYTNLYSATIIPLTFACSIRCTLGNRDAMIRTINNMIEQLKGKKCDVAQLICADEKGRRIAKPFVVGTIGQGGIGPQIKNGDYIGDLTSISALSSRMTALSNAGVSVIPTGDYIYLYCQNGDVIKTIYAPKRNSTQYYWSQARFIEDDGTYKDAFIPQEHSSFEKWKVSLSFDSIRCDEPRNLNAEEYCEISFGGSATLVNNGVKLGNDLVKVAIYRKKIVAETNINLYNGGYLEPLEMPSGSNANTNPIQLVSNKFVNNSHTDNLSLSLQYTFICDENVPLLEQWFDYARYGAQGLTDTTISPNMIYDIYEHWCSWGNYVKKAVKGKIVENIDIENTESDTLTISVTFQLQGENN